MSLFDFLHLHPWWSLVYLLIVCAAIPSLKFSFKRDGKDGQTTEPRRPS